MTEHGQLERFQDQTSDLELKTMFVIMSFPMMTLLRNFSVTFAS